MSSPISHEEPESGEPQTPPLAAVSEAAADPAEENRVPRKWLLAALAALLLFAIGFAVQTGRVGDFQEQIRGLEGEIAGLSSQLSATQQRVAAFELAREEIRQSVSLLRENVRALDALVTAEPGASPVKPTAVGPQSSETPFADLLSSEAP